MRAVDEVLINAAPGRALVVNFDQQELLVILFEALLEVKRPMGATLDEAIETIKHSEPQLHESLQRMASAAMDYVADRMRHPERELMQ